MSNATHTLNRLESATCIAANTRAASDAINEAREAIREALAVISEYEGDDHAHGLNDALGALNLASSMVLAKASSWEGYAAVRAR